MKKPLLKISFRAKPGRCDATVVFAEDGGKLLAAGAALDKKTGGALKRAIASEKFKGKTAQILSVPGTSVGTVVIAGLGKPANTKDKDCEKIGSALTAALNARKAATADVLFPTEKIKGISTHDAAARLSTGALLNSYRFDKYLTKESKDKKPPLRQISVVLSAPEKAAKAFAAQQKVSEAVFLTRDLVSEAPNVLYPESFAKIIKKELSSLGVSVRIFGRKELEKMGAGALVAVGKGSIREPKLVVMHYRGGGKSQKNIAFVGKGVTFDTGGISIKPGPGMEEMKWDMAGAGVVTGLMKALASRRAKVNAVGIVGLAENMPSGEAYRPGDIVTSLSGQTIEVHNTDAEGRLVLSDALWYVQEKFKPTHIVDLATLTGAMIIALGHEYAGLFSNDKDLAKKLVTAGAAVGEPLWLMPMNDAWDRAIDTPQADMKNISGGRDAGSAIGAHFLKRFIQDGVKWAHLDIAGVAWTNKDRTSAPKGATAFGLRLLDHMVAENFEKK